MEKATMDWNEPNANSILVSTVVVPSDVASEIPNRVNTDTMRVLVTEDCARLLHANMLK
jgi:hypothetical protein